MGHSRLSYGGRDSNTRRRAKEVICSGSLQGGKGSHSNNGPAEGKEDTAGLSSSVWTRFSSSSSVEDISSSSSIWLQEQGEEAGSQQAKGSHHPCQQRRLPAAW